jgi:glycosyltransferase involved in cell wall biosynthesis
MLLAIVHDFFCNLGGSDVCVRHFHELWPDAPIYTIVVYDRNRRHPLLQGMDLRTSFVQRLPFASRTHQPYLPLFPLAVESFDLRGYDVVLSSSHSCAKGVITRPHTLHICYCHTPMRYAWDLREQYVGRSGELRHPLGGLLARLIMHYLRLWDATTADRVDRFIANSQNVAARIAKYYRRQAVVIYPPVDTGYFTPAPEVTSPGDYYLYVGRLVPYKRVDLAVRACNELRLPLKVVGTGSELRRLRILAGPTVQILGEQPRERVRELLRRCRAFLFPGEEDFGIAPVEAQACGRPVIAYRAGGALETVVEGKTGLFFDAQRVESLIEALRAFEQGGGGAQFSPQAIRAHALQFDQAHFRSRIRQYVEEEYARFRAQSP